MDDFLKKLDQALGITEGADKPIEPKVGDIKEKVPDNASKPAGQQSEYDRMEDGKKFTNGVKGGMTKVPMGADGIKS